MERAAADDFAALGVGGRERQQAAVLGELRQLAERSKQLFAIERGEVPRFAKLRIGERRQDPVDVLEHGKAQHDAPRVEPLRRHRKAQRRLRQHGRTAHRPRNLSASGRVRGEPVALPDDLARRPNREA